MQKGVKNILCIVTLFIAFTGLLSLKMKENEPVLLEANKVVSLKNEIVNPPTGDQIMRFFILCGVGAVVIIGGGIVLIVMKKKEKKKNRKK